MFPNIIKKRQVLPYLFVPLFFSVNLFAKKNVCSITLNSKDEIEAAKANLSATDFNFIELTDFGGEDWFKQSCNNGVQCDILIISGHFGGTFFGESGKTLSIQELEEESCNRKCDGILKKPKEVFMFGCNTLAGKNQDHRTPEEYFNVLINDGFSEAAAQQVVGFRYSPLGSTFSNRMSHVFNHTPRIYGFNSVSPLGKYTGPMFNRYLKTQPDYSSYIDNIDSSSNVTFLKFFSGTAATQEKGKQLISADQLSPACFLSAENKSLSRLEKLLWIKSELEKSSNLEVLTYIGRFLKTEEWNNSWSTAETQVLNQISKNEYLKKQLEIILSSKENWIKRTQAESLELMLNLKIITRNEQMNRIVNILDLNNPNFDETKMMFVCSLNIKSNIDPADIRESNWQNYYFRMAVKCILPPWPNSRELWKYIERYE